MGEFSKAASCKSIHKSYFPTLATSKKKELKDDDIIRNFI